MTAKAKENSIFSEDCASEKELTIIESAPIADYSAVISTDVNEEAKKKGDAFAREIADRFVADFEKTEALAAAGKVDAADKMVHVSTFAVIDDMLYMTYYANTKDPSENPNDQTARFVYCPINDTENKTFFDIQTIGDTVSGRPVYCVYDTIFMQKDADTIYIMWTARVETNYYRFYRPFTISTKTMGEVQVNRFQVGEIVNDFSVSGIKSALAKNGIGCKNMYSDIGIMQKISTRVENGETYYYTGAYSGDFNCIIKSKDLITWEYVAQPDFINQSKWENATYVLGDKCFYFVRQHESCKYGFLTVYDLVNRTWEKPVLIEDCQSRSDFIVYDGQLYLFHAPIDREHIGLVKIDTEKIANSKVVFQANINGSCFYPFIQYYMDNELAMSYTVDRKHIRLARFTLNDYLK